jgi:hypothetical protein
MAEGMLTIDLVGLLERLRKTESELKKLKAQVERNERSTWYNKNEIFKLKNAPEEQKR